MEKILDNIRKYNMIESGDKILIGLSGGPDSVFLFHVLNEIKNELNFSLYIAHINHGVRGEEALRDEKFVENLALENNIPYYLKTANMDEYAKENNLSSEEAGRKLRYDFFYHILDKINGDKIAVGHNKSDQAETILMRFFRGTGIDGLRGMEYKVGKIIRPILNIEREEIENYLIENNYEFKLDHTNLETIYNRNKIRLETIPHIEKNYNPNIIDTLFRTADNFKADSDFLYEYTKKAYDNMLKLDIEGEIILNKEKLLEEHNSIKSRVIRYSIGNILGNLQGITQKHIVDTLEFIENSETGKSINLIKNIIIKLEYENIIISNKDDSNKDKYSYILNIGKNNLEELNLIIDIDLIDIDGYKVLKDEHNTKYFDYSKIEGDLYLRNRRNGDIFFPLGMKGRSKKIKDFFIDEKIPRDKREEIPLLTDDKNIIWIMDYRISEKYKIDSDTNKVLRIKFYGGKYG